MDLGALVVTSLSSLAIGAALGWYGHRLTLRRSREERKSLNDVERVDRTVEVFNARVKYVLAFHRKTRDYLKIKDAYLDLKRRYRYADPEVLCEGMDEWEAYADAERAARRDESTPIEQRLKEVEQTSYRFLDRLAEYRDRVTG